MNRKRLLILIVFLLMGCQNEAPATATATPPLLPTVAPVTAVPPTATSLAEGWVTQFSTPDPTCPEQSPWFFHNPAQECATTLLNTWAVMQPFEHGLMVWFQEGGRTYVFLDDGSLFKPYQEVSDPGGTAVSAPDPAITPPPGLYQPELGFARFWQGLVPGSEWIRPQLGWALAPEVGYSALWQCNNATDHTARCYFTGPGDEIIVLSRGEGRYWNYWQEAVR